jgi:hypothetical protein
MMRCLRVIVPLAMGRGVKSAEVEPRVGGNVEPILRSGTGTKRIAERNFKLFSFRFKRFNLGCKGINEAKDAVNKHPGHKRCKST